jgi:hypothetical protein
MFMKSQFAETTHRPSCTSHVVHDEKSESGTRESTVDGIDETLSRVVFRLSENECSLVTMHPRFSELARFELEELTRYRLVYYLGASKREKKNAFMSGFDDHHGQYVLLKHDHIVFRYEILKLLGTGTFASVWELCIVFGWFLVYIITI